MKFAKYLQDEVVPEWRKAYINYKQGKKHLKAIECALDELERGGPLDPTIIPIELLDTVQDHGPGTELHPQISHVHYYPQQPPLPSTLPQIPRHMGTTGIEDDSAAQTTTPIISRKRGHGRNYSAIIIPPAPSSSIASQQTTNTPSLQGTTLADEDRSRVGGSTIQESDTIRSGSGNSGRPSPPVKTGSTGSTAFQFGQAARSQSSHILKSLSRRFTIVAPSDFPSRTRSLQIDENSFDSILDQLLPEERVFFNFLDTQLDMVNSFYKEKELEAVTKLKVIKQQLFVANEWKRRYDAKMAKAEAERGWYMAEWSRVRKGLDNLMRADSAITEDVTIGPLKTSTHLPALDTAFTTSAGLVDPEHGLRHRDIHAEAMIPDVTPGKTNIRPMVGQDDIVLQEAENRREHLNHKVARTRIKAALYEFYRSLEMIKNYKVLNHTGFAKILKKFDKTAGWKASKPYANQKLKPAYFMTSGVIQDLIAETEDVFIDAFEKGHRRRGMAKLRIPDSKKQTHHLTATRIGLYMGLAAPLLVQALQSAFSQDTPAEIPYWDSLLLVYAGLFLTILFACLFGINMYVWAKSRINYKFIFEFDPRDNLDFHEYFELPILLMLLLTLAVYLDFGSKLTAHVATAYWPLILMAIAVVILFCPLPIAHFTARRWFLSSIGRILASGYYRVEFRDFFLADEMNSLSYSIEQFEFALCAYSQQWTDLGLPAWFRFLQCLRRYRDTLEWFPHLLNAGKYSASLLNLFIYFSYRHYGGPQLKAAFIVASFFTSVYTFTWDIYMDWGLFRFGKHGGGAHGHPFLRQELVYSRMWVYYMAIVLDFLGRFSWLMRLVPMNVNVYFLSFSLALVEVLRRWQWNFFRLENEHLNNCGQFRAIKDIPLPFHIRVKGESDDDDDDEDDEDENKSGDEDEHRATAGIDSNTKDSDRKGNNFHPSTASLHRPGAVRSTSSQSSFAKQINGGHAHSLSNIGGSATGGHDAITSRASVHSAASSQNLSYQYNFDQQQPVHPFGTARSNTFVDAAVAEAGFKDSARAVLESEANSNKFYDRRDFDSKIIDADSNTWNTRPGYNRGRSATGSSILGMQNLSLGAAGGEDNDVRMLDMERRSRSQGLSRRKMSIGTKMRRSIFGPKKRGSDTDDEDEDDEM